MKIKLYRVNEVARELGVSETFLRRGEKEGRIPEARRDWNGWRIYTEEDITELRQFLIPHRKTKDKKIERRYMRVLRKIAKEQQEA